MREENLKNTAFVKLQVRAKQEIGDAYPGALPSSTLAPPCTMRQYMATVVCLQTSEACLFQGQSPVLSVPGYEPLGILSVLGIETPSKTQSESRA